MTFEFKTSSQLWTNTLAERPRDKDSVKRGELRNAFLAMRKNVEPMVSAAHRDCPGLTVHDLTHLDALWLTAARIAGPKYPLTPTEGFVLGCAILLHDAGMAVASYDGGIDAIRSRPEWQDAVRSAMNRLGAPYPPPGNQPLPDPIRLAADFSVLRRLHAHQAEILATKAFEHPTDKTDMFLLDDPDLRDAYGSTIGKIAHSHHWDVDRLPHELRQDIGAPPGFPDAWTVDAVKVASLLRCADAAHIDSERAPRMLFSLNRPSGISLQHWLFQNKILQSTARGDKIVYSSQKPFTAGEAQAWWLGYDVIEMIDRELSSTSALLEQLDLKPLAISGVVGADSPRLLAKHIETSGWQPVNAKVQVSDPTHLARTLGGRNLYGDTVFAPIRELLTNAVDSVRARRTEEERDDEWGVVRVTLEADADDSDAHWLHVDDTGLGMSEPVLTGALLDFGTSHWSSSGLQDEYPGLIARGFKPTGKFGIGFFSIFLLGDHVRVCSRPFRNGDADTKVLEFQSLEYRPIVRSPFPKEMPLDFTTRVSVKISNATSKSLHSFTPKPNPSSYYMRPARPIQSIKRYVQNLVATLNVRVEFLDKETDDLHVHKPNWHEQPAADVIQDLVPGRKLNKRVSDKINVLFDYVFEDDQVVGLAALPSSARVFDVGSHVSVDGFTYSPEDPSDHYRRTSYNYTGILFGNTDDAARQEAVPCVKAEDLAEWANRQAKRLSALDFAPLEGLRASHDIYLVGGDPLSLPFAFARKGFLDRSQVIAFLTSRSRIIMPMNFSYHAEVIPVGKLDAHYFTGTLTSDVLVGATEQVRMGWDNKKVEELSKRGEKIVLAKAEADILLTASGLRGLARLISETWDQPLSCTITPEVVFEDTMLSAYTSSWVLSLVR